MMEREFKDSGIEWIGRIPKEWKTVPFKAYFSTGKGLSFTKADLTPSGKAVVSYGQIHSKQNTGTRLDDFLIRFIPDSLTENGESSRMNKGDFIFADTSEDLEGCGNSVYVDRETELYAGYHSVTAKSKVQQANKYFAYYFLTPCWRSQIRSRVTGIKVFSISQSIINQTSIIVPPFTEQQRIADYLDKKCGEIDELIALQEQMIAQLTDYKQSVITEAVTKGLNPDAEFVPSGIDWIGDVPKGWKVAKAKYFVFINNGSDPQEEGDIPVYGSGASSFKTCGEYKEGPTVLIGRKGATLHIPHYIEGKYWNVDTAFDVKIRKGMSLRFYYYLAICFDYKYYISQTTLPGMAQSSYYNMNIPIPPLPEQQSIATYLDTKCSEIDSLIAIKQQKIETLKDYKKSVIYEAVTGKMTV
jgi:type I restriction enzyme S subunit